MYKLSYRRRFIPFTFTIPNAVGHSYVQATDKLWVATQEGGREIRNWSQCEIILGKDWLEYFKEQERLRIEQEAKVPA